jgi:hypothetical protein
MARRILPCLPAAFLFSATSQAQSDSYYIISRQGSVAIQPLYQSWSVKDGMKFSELGTTLSVYFPVSRSMNFSVRGGQVNAAGDVAKVNGATDFQLGGAYYWEAANMVFSCGLNLPSGKKELTAEQFETSVLFSSTQFDLQYPGFGQGFNIVPGVAWAYPVNDAVVIGLGGSYQLKGKYKPLQGMDDYQPGGELTFTGGADIRLNEISTLSADLVFTKYGTDKIGGDDVFTSGNAYSANVQFKHFFRENELWLFARYRTKAKGEITSATGLIPEPERIEPGHFLLLAQYKLAAAQHLSIRFLGEGRFFEKTASPLSGANFVGVGVLPTISLQGGIFFPFRVVFQYGSQSGDTKYTGIEAGAGIGFAF